MGVPSNRETVVGREYLLAQSTLIGCGGSTYIPYPEAKISRDMYVDRPTEG